MNCSRNRTGLNCIDYDNALGTFPQLHQARSLSDVFMHFAGAMGLIFQMPSNHQAGGIVMAIRVTNADHKNP